MRRAQRVCTAKNVRRALVAHPGCETLREMKRGGTLVGGGSFTAQKLNMHARTNMGVISRFLPVRFETREEGGLTRVSVAGNISVRD